MDNLPQSLEGTLMAVHQQLDDIFFRHQCALLDRDSHRASRLLSDYSEGLLAHINEEERYILPRYQQHGGDATDAPLRLFHGEHQNLRHFLAEFAERLHGWTQSSADRALLELLDREATFKNLLVHHDLRERNMLYPHLGRCLSAAEQEHLLTQMRGQVRS
jgi:hemerythrin-like domain-containing protein